MDKIKEKFQVDLRISPLVKNNPKEIYSIFIECDANDGDIVNGTLQIEKDDFESNYTLQFVLSFVNGEYGKFRKNHAENGFYGAYINTSEIKDLSDFCIGEGILLYCGVMDDCCHSITNIEITYFDNEGKEFEVKLPNIDNYFDTKEELIEYLENLLKTYKYD